MSVSSSIKRQNFNVTVDEEAELHQLREALGAASVKDALLRATRVVLSIANEVHKGHRIYVSSPHGEQTRLLLPDIERPAFEWVYLTSRPHSWKRQLFVKGRRLSAANVWLDMKANRLSIAEAAENWGLPVAAIDEIARYCEVNRDLISMEAAEEQRCLHESGKLAAPEIRR